MKHIMMYLALAVVVNLSGCSFSRNPEAESAAIAAAKAWLALVGGEKYAESWDEAAQYLKGAIQKDQWVQTMQSMRKPFGKNMLSELKSRHYRTALPGAPDGQYVIIRFRASFEHKQSTLETITPMLDKDGQWRVSGYFMQ